MSRHEVRNVIVGGEAVIYHGFARLTWSFRVIEKVKIKCRTCSVYFIGLAQLIKNKEAVKRNRDLEDLKYLKAAARKLNEKPRKK